MLTEQAGIQLNLELYLGLVIFLVAISFIVCVYCKCYEIYDARRRRIIERNREKLEKQRLFELGQVQIGNRERDRKRNLEYRRKHARPPQVLLGYTPKDKKIGVYQLIKLLEAEQPKKKRRDRQELKKEAEQQIEDFERDTVNSLVESFKREIEEKGEIKITDNTHIGKKRGYDVLIWIRGELRRMGMNVELKKHKLVLVDGSK